MTQTYNTIQLSKNQVQSQNKLLKEENLKLKDLVCLLNLQLENQIIQKQLCKKQNQILLGKYNLLEKQKQEVAKRYQQLVQIKNKNNLNLKSKLSTRTQKIYDTPKQIIKKQTQVDSKQSTDKSLKQQKISKLNVLLKHVDSQKRLSQFCLSNEKQTLSYFKLKQNRFSISNSQIQSQSRLSINSNDKTNFRHRKSYLQKLRAPLTY